MSEVETPRLTEERLEEIKTKLEHDVVINTSEAQALIAEVERLHNAIAKLRRYYILEGEALETDRDILSDWVRWKDVQAIIDDTTTVGHWR